MDLRKMTKLQIAKMIDSLNLRLNGFSLLFEVYYQYYSKDELINFYKTHFC